MKLSRWILASVAAATLVAGAPHDALAKPKRVINATVNGKRLKPTPRTVFLGAEGGTIGFLAQAQKIAIHGTTKTLLVSCAVVLAGRTYPFTSTDCLTSYSESKGLRHPVLKVWTDIVTGATQVTFDSYDGTNIAGSFHGVAPAGPTNAGLPPVTVDGTFHGVVQQGNPNR